MNIHTTTVEVDDLEHSIAVRGRIQRMTFGDIYLKWSEGLNPEGPVRQTTAVLTPAEAVQYAQEILKIAGATNITFTMPAAEAGARCTPEGCSQ